VALDELAFHTAESLKPLFAAKHLLLKLDLPADPVWIQGDRMALDLLIRNLLENALKFTQQGCISLSVTQGHQHCTLKVEDSGQGLPEEAIAHLFERFYQADTRHRRQGSGLGLALVKSISVWHGGTISAHNLPAGGALFQLELPLLLDTSK
jgi:signal transduction histidine kinase